MENTEKEYYYVSMVSCLSNDNKVSKAWLLAGPYDTHEEALSQVDTARNIAVENDAKNWFYSFGTCKTKLNKPGILNKHNLI